MFFYFVLENDFDIWTIQNEHLKKIEKHIQD
jgi:hypothetical protein